MESPLFKPQTNVSLRERVTHDIREAILAGRLQPGFRIREAEIADQMGVSRGPVREAIRQLEREGLMISQPYKDTVVADIDAEEVRDILVPIRFHLEWFVIRKYIPAVDHAFFDKLDRLIDQMEAAILNGEINRIVELDIAFHEQIIDLAKERTVKLTWQSIQYQIRLHFNKNARHYDTPTFAKAHSLLLDKLRSRDMPAIREELLAHLCGEDSFLFDEP